MLALTDRNRTLANIKKLRITEEQYANLQVLKIKIPLTLNLADTSDVPEVTTDKIRFVLQNVKKSTKVKIA